MMNRIERFSIDDAPFDMNWHRQFIQGIIISLTGITFSLASILQSNAVVMSARFYSWLPVCAMILLALGLLGSLDAFLAKEQRDFFQNLQVGVLDSVVGTLIILSTTGALSRLSLLIAAFLITRGIVRMTLAHVFTGMPQKNVTSFCGIISILTGIMVWLEWPIAEGWFLSFCLSIEITFRGWAMIMFGLWIKGKHQN